ncbi:hypothetical protein [Cellulosilyticum ruminicola]|uniref:hypothetical protein n=1 Tax=Cellulosilyticum ruminicola TaxID=425254 RepID=UPI0006D1D4A3|nr:hypothetical protein [Cellulosilyticum ruminicola]
MFRKNTVQQLNLGNPTINLPKYLRKNLEKSWATPFNQYIFSNINETIYRTRDKDATTKLEYSIILKEVCSKYDTQILECEAFKLLKRLLEEQVEVNEEGKTVPKDAKSLHSEIL